MGVTKRSISMDTDIANAVDKAAADDGVAFSTWLGNAAQRELRRRDGLAAVSEWEAEAGPLTNDEIAAGEALLDQILRDRA